MLFWKNSKRKTASKADWKVLNMPESTETFYFDRNFSEKQMETMYNGYIPEEMEDKWFCYVEDDRLYMHRSSTGYCIYIVEFSKTNHHKVTMNTDENQRYFTEQYFFRSNDKIDDIRLLNYLLDTWIMPENAVLPEAEPELLDT